MNDGKMLLSGRIGDIVDIVDENTHSMVIKSNECRRLGSLLFDNGLVDNVDNLASNVAKEYVWAEDCSVSVLDYDYPERGIRQRCASR